MPMPPALEKELIRQRTPVQYERSLLPKKTKNKRLFRKKKIAQRSGRANPRPSPQVEDVTDRMVAEGKVRATEVREAAAAIKAGRAEAHPIVEKVGFHGPVVMEEPEVREMGEIFTESLLRTYAARQKGKKKKQLPRMAVPDPGYEYARR